MGGPRVEMSYTDVAYGLAMRAEGASLVGLDDASLRQVLSCHWCDCPAMPVIQNMSMTSESFGYFGTYYMRCNSGCARSAVRERLSRHLDPVSR